MPQPLSPTELSAALAALPAWSGDRAGIARTITAPTFPRGIELVDAVARAAEAADHHPDIDIRWCDVTFRLCTHSAGGVTDLDVSMARRIDELAAELLAGG